MNSRVIVKREADKKPKPQPSKVSLFHANVLNSATLNLNRDEIRVLLLCKKKITQLGAWPEDDLFRFTRQEYSTEYGVGEDEAGRDLKKAINGFRGKYITLREQMDGVWMEGEIDWTTSRWRCDQRGVYAIKLNSDLKPYLMPNSYEKLFTITQFEEARRLNTKWSQLLYDMLCQFQETGMCIARIDDIRIRWATPKSYDKWSLFKTRIIEPSVDELRKIARFSTLTWEVKHREGNAPSVIMFQF
ncbi:replication initiation protein [Aeromonas veronii]|uniref:replication initiation protein n=1 Tax=Aeromonas TaxID=642 RepID=UPI003444B52F